MGQDVAARVFSREDRQRYREKVRTCLDVFARMLADERFDADARLDRAGDRAQPHRRRPATRRWPTRRCSRRSPTPTSRPSSGSSTSRSTSRRASSPATVFAELEERVRGSLNHAEEQRAHGRRAHGDDRDPADPRPGRTSTPTPSAPTRATRCSTSRSSPPAARTSRSTSAASSGCRPTPTRSRPRRRARASSCTCRSSPTRSPRYWNAAQAIAGVQVAVGANSPFFFGKELWRETRIALFEQATDTRPDELKAQGVRPRVWFGERWITSIFDLFEENVRYFPALLPVCEDEDPVEMLDARRRPRARPSCACTTARSTAGTGRSTTSCAAARTCASRTGSCPPARPSSTCSPTRPSTTAWCARWPRTTGRCGRRCRSRPPRRTSTPARATASTRASTGPASARCRSTELVLRRLLPLAHEGLDALGVDAADRDRLLGIIERRCVTQRNGASWQSAVFHRLYDDGGLERDEALRADDRALPRAHARQRAGPRVAAGLAHSAPGERQRRPGVCTIWTSVFSLIEPPGGMVIVRGL